MLAGNNITDDLGGGWYKVMNGDEIATSTTTTMASNTLALRDSPIIIVGAGVFGLSSAIHLAQRGYRNVTVFDKQPYHETFYDFESGCDAASAGKLQ